MVAERLGIGEQPLAFLLSLAPIGGDPLALLVEGPPSLAQDGEQVDGVALLGVVQPARFVGDPVEAPRQFAGAAQEEGVLAPSLCIAARKERARASVVVTRRRAGQNGWRSRHAPAFA